MVKVRWRRGETGVGNSNAKDMIQVVAPAQGRTQARRLPLTEGLERSERRGEVQPTLTHLLVGGEVSWSR